MVMIKKALKAKSYLHTCVAITVKVENSESFRLHNILYRTMYVNTHVPSYIVCSPPYQQNQYKCYVVTHQLS